MVDRAAPDSIGPRVATAIAAAAFGELAPTKPQGFKRETVGSVLARDISTATPSAPRSTRDLEATIRRRSGRAATAFKGVVAGGPDSDGERLGRDVTLGLDECTWLPFMGPTKRVPSWRLVRGGFSKDWRTRAPSAPCRSVRGRLCGAFPAHAGRLNQNRVRPRPDSTPTRPPAASTSWRTMARPIPVPPCTRSRDLSTR